MASATEIAVPPTALLGRWLLARRLVDYRLDRYGSVVGHLELERDGDIVRWRETGELRWDGGRYSVSRELHVVPVGVPEGVPDGIPEGAGWQVRFADGRPFHPWVPGRFVEHPCRTDLYRGLIAVDAARSGLRVLWDVTGPGKHQRILTRCRRQPTAMDSFDSPPQ